MNIYKSIYYQFRFNGLKQTSRLMCLDCQDFIRKGAKVIDLGCGSGIIGQTLSTTFDATVIGADVRDDRVVDLPFQVVDGGILPFKENEFDVCLISYVLHHTENPLFLLQEAKRICKGKIIIYEDLPEGLLPRSRCHVHLLFSSFLTGVFRQRFNFKTQQEWERLFEDLGFWIFAKKRVYKNNDWIDPVKRVLYVLEKIQTNQSNTSVKYDFSLELAESNIKEEIPVYV